MDKLKKVLGALKGAVSDEVHLVKKLKGKKLEKLCSDFCLDEDILIYYTQYNLIFINKTHLDQVSPYLKQKDLVLELNIPQSGVFMAIYQYFNSQLLETYID